MNDLKKNEINCSDLIIREVGILTRWVRL